MAAPAEDTDGGREAEELHGAGSREDSTEPPVGMRRNNDRLQEMLRLARGCLRGGRLPGEPRTRHLFGRFDEEVAAANAAALAKEAALDAELRGFVGLLRPTPPAAPTPEGLSPEEHAAKVRRDVRRLERTTAERRQELDSLNSELAKEVLARCRVQDEVAAAKVEVQKRRRFSQEAKDMVRRQEREIQELRNVLAEAFAAAAAAASAPRPQSEAAGGGAVTVEKAAGGPRPLRKKLDGSAAPAAAAVVNEPASASADEPPSAPGLNVAELRGALLPDWQPAPAEAPIWDHLQNENEKLVSVIDAVDELSRQLRASRGGLSMAELSDLAAEGDGDARPSADGVPPPLAYFVPCHLRPPLRPKVYAAVLANRPSTTRATRSYA